LANINSWQTKTAANSAFKQLGLDLRAMGSRPVPGSGRGWTSKLCDCTNNELLVINLTAVMGRRNAIAPTA